LAFLAPEAKTALGNRFGRMASNVPRLAVTALAERLRINGFSDPDLWADWIRCDMDQLSGVAHREALLLGDSYVIVWADRFAEGSRWSRRDRLRCRPIRAPAASPPR
jgi:hypothetical protein